MIKNFENCNRITSKRSKIKERERNRFSKNYKDLIDSTSKQ